MKFRLLLMLVVAFLSPSLAVADEVADDLCKPTLTDGRPDYTLDDHETPTLDLRIGGSVESFMDAYGKPDSDKVGFEWVEVGGCNNILINDYEGIVDTIWLWAPDEGWNFNQAESVALHVLPFDAEMSANAQWTALEQATVDNMAGTVAIQGSSTYLYDSVPNAVWDYVDNTPTYGDFTVVYWQREAGTVEAVLISLADEEDV